MDTGAESEGPRPCETCGSPTALRLGGRDLCETCCQTYGSCCMEFGGYDLWSEASPDPEDGRRQDARQTPAAT